MLPVVRMPPRRPKSTPAYAVPALDRGLDVIEALAAARRPLSLSELGATLGTSPGILYRFLARLEQRGYLSRDAATGKYSLSVRLYALALAEDPIHHLLRKARLPMELLAEEIHESCHLSILLGRRLVVLLQAPAPAPVRLTVDTGSTHEAALTTSGQLLMALRPAADWPKLGPKVPVRRLRAIAAAGHFAGPSERLLGVRDLAVPVALPDGHAALALSYLSPPGAKTDRVAELLPALRRTATQISTALGLNPS
jgi:DNA-binding IclR family transcriptional regulator